MFKVLIVMTIVSLIAWRYRRVLGMSEQWDRVGAERVEDLAAKLGWSRSTQTKASARTVHPVQQSGRTGWAALMPNINGERLPASMAVGVLVGVIAAGLDIQGYAILSTVVGMVLGPYLGGVYLRTKWWLLVAPFVAFVTGAAGEMGTLITAVPVAVIAYAGMKTDVTGWIARMNAGDRPSRS